MVRVNWICVCPKRTSGQRFSLPIARKLSVGESGRGEGISFASSPWWRYIEMPPTRYSPAGLNARTRSTTSLPRDPIIHSLNAIHPSGQCAKRLVSRTSLSWFPIIDTSASSFSSSSAVSIGCGPDTKASPRKTTWSASSSAFITARSASALP